MTMILDDVESTSEVTSSQGFVLECRICGEETEGAHLGINACRACAAFYRRSIVQKKSYTCSLGNDSCNVYKSVRCICRKCRLQKCIDAGMKIERIDQLEDKEKEKDEGMKKMAMTSSMRNKVRDAICILIGGNTPIIQSNIPNLLIKVAENYKNLCSVRKSSELKLLTEMGYKKSNEESVDGFILARTLSLTSIHKSNLPLVGEFMNSTFPEFERLDHDEKWLVLKSSLNCFNMLEGVNRTFTLLPPEDRCKKMLCSETLYMDVTNLSYVFDDIQIDSVCRDNLIKICEKICHRCHIPLLRHMDKLRVNSLEFAALLILAVFSPVIDKCQLTTREIAEQIRSSVFRELRILYADKHPEDATARIGSLMAYYAYVQCSIIQMQESLNLFNLFDGFKADPFLYHLLKR